jgi:hypothetical protein
MDEGVFMGASKIFLRNLPIGFVPTLLYRKFFWRNLNTGCRKILKKPIECQSMGKKQRLPHF